eukprot:3937635-Rhodomonas_salina.1
MRMVLQPVPGTAGITPGRPEIKCKKTACLVQSVLRWRCIAFDFAACIGLCACYAMTGTDILYAATLPSSPRQPKVSEP